MYKRFYILTAALFSMTMLLSGCGKNTLQSTGEINFAVTGDKALFDYDDSFLKGVDMAIEDCNELYRERGCHIGMQFFDDEAVYEKGIVISNLIAKDEKITAVLGSQSFQIINTAAGIFESAKKILITPYGANDETMEEGYQYVFRNTHSANNMGISLAKYAKEKGYKKIAFGIEGGEYETALVRGFYRESLNSDLKIVDYIKTYKTQYEFDEAFERWELLGVDCVAVILDSVGASFDLLQAIRSKNPEMPVIGDIAFDFKERLAEYRRFSDDIVIAGLLNIENSEKTGQFKNRYFEKYKALPTDYAIQGYDSVKMVVDTAVRIKTNDPALIAKELHEKEYDGISGTIRFDEKGRLISGLPNLLISEEGAFRRLPQ